MLVLQFFGCDVRLRSAISSAPRTPPLYCDAQTTICPELGLVGIRLPARPDDRAGRDRDGRRGGFNSSAAGPRGATGS